MTLLIKISSICVCLGLLGCTQSAGKNPIGVDGQSSSSQSSGIGHSSSVNGSSGQSSQGGSSTGSSSTGSSSSGMNSSSSGAPSSASVNEPDPLLDLGAFASYFKWIPGGTFTRSDAVKVTVNGFYMSTTEIPQNLYEQILGNNPSFYSSLDSAPVERVSFVDAVTFCNALSDSLGFATLYSNILVDAQTRFDTTGVRLPTEAEWEYAARAGSTQAYSWGSSISSDTVSLYTNPLVVSSTAAVGKYSPNAFGLYDMHGNVGEWVNDWYAPLGLDFVLVNPTGPSSGASRVYRDGGFDELLSYRSLFVTQRRSALPGDMQPNRGFRVVISVKH